MSHTAENIRERVTNVLTEYKVEEKVVCSSTDNAHNEKAAMDLAGIPNFGCLSHTLNLAVNWALKTATRGQLEDLGDLQGEDAGDSSSAYERLTRKSLNWWNAPSAVTSQPGNSDNAKRM